MKRIIPSETPVRELHQYIIGTVAPRPIAFASTISEDGVPNLAPFSFFNAFASHPPTLIFSPNRRVRDNTTKHTLHNAEVTGEVVINIVSYNIVRQMALCSIEYPSGVNEFDKAGLTAIPSEKVKPFRVKESKAQYECKVRDIVRLGKNGGAGNLIICDVVLLHLDDSLFDDQGKIDPQKLDPVARMCRNFYARAHGDSIFSIYQPVGTLGIGFDNMPEHVKKSPILTGNELAELAAVEELPVVESVGEVIAIQAAHAKAKDLIAQGDIESAWRVLLS